MDRKADRESGELLARIQDAAVRAQRSDRPVFTRFLNPAQIAQATAHVKKSGLEIGSFGGYHTAERRMMCLSPFEVTDYPIACLSVISTDGSVRSHRDYLGALLNLGLDRECLGDIVVREKDALVFCIDTIAPFLTMELTRVGSSVVRTQEVDIAALSVDRKTAVSTATVSSLRLDCVVAAFAHLSRTDSTTLITRGLVQVNYQVCEKSAASLSDGDTLSVRGHGKFVLHVSDRLSKKGRIHIQMEQYI